MILTAPQGTQDAQFLVSAALFQNKAIFLTQFQTQPLKYVIIFWSKRK